MTIGTPAARRVSHALGDGPEDRQLQALLHDEPGAQGDGHGAAHRDVVDRAVHREIADASTREEEGPDDVGVGREGQPAGPGDRERGGVVHLGALDPAERRQEQMLDEFGRELAATAVADDDPVVAPQRQRARPVLEVGGGIRPGVCVGHAQLLPMLTGTASSRRYWK
ncbi:MAG: hypothetical protein R2715_00215 [Ilumatobacteraceae bacterium]